MINWEDEGFLLSKRKFRENANIINIFTEKKGKIKIVNINSKKILEVKHNLNFLDVGQGGLLDIIYQNLQDL